MRRPHVLALLPLAFAASTRLTTAQAPSGEATRRAAVQRLMEVSRVRQMMEQTTETMLNGQLQQMPQPGPYAGILRDFYREQMSWAVLEPEFTKVYLDVFTEAELREMIAFYESPLGQKLLDKMPVLMAKTNELTSRRLQDAMPKLMQRLEAAMQAGTRSDSTPPKKP